MISSATFRSFTDHMKAASAAGAAAGAAEHPLAALVRKIKPRDAMLVAGYIVARQLWQLTQLIRWAQQPLGTETPTTSGAWEEAYAKLRRRPKTGEIRDDADGLRAVGDRLIEQAGVARWRYRSAAGAQGNAAASVAFLVPRREVAAFLSRIAPVASRAESIAVVPTGPWPPYSFAPPLERLPLAPADGGLPGGARTPARDAPIPHRAAGGGAGGVLPPRTRSG